MTIMDNIRTLIAKYRQTAGHMPTALHMTEATWVKLYDEVRAAKLTLTECNTERPEVYGIPVTIDNEVEPNRILASHYAKLH